MVEKEVIIKRLVFLEEYIRDLEEVRQQTNQAQFIQDKKIRRYVERMLHLAIEACLDIANHIISYQGFREPKSNRDSFEVLKEQQIIDAELAEQLKKMAQFRNIIVHDYIEIQDEIVFSVLTHHVEDIIRFGNQVRQQFL